MKTTILKDRLNNLTNGGVNFIEIEQPYMGMAVHD